MPDASKAPLKDAHVTIEGDQYTVELVMDRVTALPQFKATYIDVLELDEESSRLSVAVSLINLVSDECVDCDHYDHSIEDPKSRCTKGVDCLQIGNGCGIKTTEIADEIYGPTVTEKDEQPPSRFDEIDTAPIREVPVREAFENQEVARFRAQMCLENWGGYSLEEKRKIVEDMESTSKEAMDAMYRELMALPPQKREDAIEFLAAHGQNDLGWWRSFLGTWEL